MICVHIQTFQQKYQFENVLLLRVYHTLQALLIEWPEQQAVLTGLLPLALLQRHLALDLCKRRARGGALYSTYDSLSLSNSPSWPAKVKLQSHPSLLPWVASLKEAFKKKTLAVKTATHLESDFKKSQKQSSPLFIFVSGNNMAWFPPSIFSRQVFPQPYCKQLASTRDCK